MENKYQKIVQTINTLRELEINIQDCSDPNNENKATSVIGIIHNAYKLIVSKNTSNNIDEAIKNKASLIISSCKYSIGGNNLFFIETKRLLTDMDLEKYNVLLKNCKNIIKQVLDKDRDIDTLQLINFINDNTKEAILESVFDKVAEHIKAVDIDMLKKNNIHIDKQLLQTLLNDYETYFNFISKSLKEELKQQRKIR